MPYNAPLRVTIDPISGKMLDSTPIPDGTYRVVGRGNDTYEYVPHPLDADNPVPFCTSGAMDAVIEPPTTMGWMESLPPGVDTIDLDAVDYGDCISRF